MVECIEVYNTEKMGLKGLKLYLVKTSRLIDRSSKAKKEMRTLMKDIHEQFSHTKDKII